MPGSEAGHPRRPRLYLSPHHSSDLRESAPFSFSLPPLVFPIHSPFLEQTSWCRFSTACLDFLCCTTAPRAKSLSRTEESLRRSILINRLSLLLERDNRPVAPPVDPTSIKFPSPTLASSFPPKVQADKRILSCKARHTSTLQ